MWYIVDIISHHFPNVECALFVPLTNAVGIHIAILAGLVSHSEVMWSSRNWQWLL